MLLLYHKTTNNTIKNIDINNLSDNDKAFYIKYLQDSKNKKLDDKELRELYNDYLKEPIPHPHETMDTDIKDTILKHDNGVMESRELETKKIANFTYITQETKSIRDLRNDLKEALTPYKSKPIINKETGMQGIITIDEINKISSKKAVDKSIANGFSKDEHFRVAQDLKTLFENSVLKESHADNKQRANIKVHRFIKDLNINTKEAQAKITLFEKIEGKNRIYTLELENLDKPESLSV